jgi:hypothetical protein
MADESGTDVNEPETRRVIRPTTVIAVLFLLSLAGFWGWIWYYQVSNQGERDMPDRLNDLSWTEHADQICQAADARIAALPTAQRTPSAEERAAVIIAATDEIEHMLRDIEAIAPAGTDRDATITAAWISDYREWLADRYRYADALLDDPAARFVVTEKYGSHITAPIDRFARVNEMESCMTSGDV